MNHLATAIQKRSSRRLSRRIIAGVFCAVALLLVREARAAGSAVVKMEPQLISLMDRAVLKVEFSNAKNGHVELPKVDGLRFRSQGKSYQTQIINFHSSSKVVYTYLVTPTRTGDFDVGPIVCSWKGGGDTLSTKLRVVAGAGKGGNSGNASGSTGKPIDRLSDLLFSRVSTPRKHPFVYEEFPLLLKVYVRDGSRIGNRFGVVGGMPENGLDGNPEWEIADRTRETTNGVIYDVYLFRTTVRTFTSGKFRFSPKVQLQLVVPRQNRRSFGFDDAFFGDFFGRTETRPVVLDCNELVVDVRPVPIRGRPKTFTGGVGRFRFDVSVGPKSVKTGEPVTVKMRISGSGNLDRITPPEIPRTPNLKTYEPRIVSGDNPGELRFEQVVIPLSGEVREIPPIAFTYFDVKTEEFRTHRCGPFPIRVAPGEQKAAQVMPGTTRTNVRRETELLGNDILYLKPMPKGRITRNVVDWYRTPAGMLLLVLPGLLALLVASFAFHRRRMAADVARTRRGKAPKVAREALRRAAAARKRHDAIAFFAELDQAMKDYFAHRLNLSPGEATRAVVEKRFPEIADEARPIFDAIDRRRYGGAEEASPEEMKDYLRHAERLLKQCERVKR